MPTAATAELAGHTAKLTELVPMRDQGSISDEEFKSKKNQLPGDSVKGPLLK